MSYAPYEQSKEPLERPPPKKFFSRSNWREILILVIVIVVISLVLNVLFYTRPW